MANSKNEEKTPEFRSAVQGASAGLIVGLLWSIGLTAWLFEWSNDLPSGEEAWKRSGVPSLQGCQAQGLQMVNDISCRPSQDIDFYLIEDHSRSLGESSYEGFPDVIERFFLEKGDRVACLGFAQRLIPRAATPDRDFRRGCKKRREWIARQKKEGENSQQFKKTDFVNLFRSLGKRLAEERENGEPHYRSGVSHRDLVIILSDGLHDPQNRPRNWKTDLLPNRDDVGDELRDLKAVLDGHEDEVWLFMVLVDWPPGLAADLEQWWKGFRQYGLNVILPRSGFTAEEVVREVFETMSSSQIQLSLEGEVPNAERKRLDVDGVLDARYRIVKDDRDTFTIRNRDILIRRASLVDEKDGGEMSLTAWNKAADFDQARGTHIDGSKDFVDISFRLGPSADRVDPFRSYRLELELGGSARALTFAVPHRWQAELNRILDLSKIALLLLLLGSSIVLYPWLRNPQGIQEEGRFTRTAKWLVGFQTLALLVVSVGGLLVTPRLEMNVQFVASVVSLVSVFYLQQKHNLVTDGMVAAVALFKTSSTNMPEF